MKLHDSTVPPPELASEPSTEPFTEPANRLGISGLEQVYDSLALALDQAGPDKSEIFLVKLALLNAQALADAAVFQAHVATALKDL
jgi:hypothetical protein